MLNFWNHLFFNEPVINSYFVVCCFWSATHWFKEYWVNWQFLATMNSWESILKTWNSTCILRHSRWSQWGGKKSFWSDENEAIFTSKLTNLRLLAQTNFKLVIINVTRILFTSLHKVSWWTLSISEYHWVFTKTDLKSHPIRFSLCQGKRAEPMSSILAPSKEPRSELTWKLLSFN